METFAEHRYVFLLAPLFRFGAQRIKTSWHRGGQWLRLLGIGAHFCPDPGAEIEEKTSPPLGHPRSKLMRQAASRCVYNNVPRFV